VATLGAEAREWLLALFVDEYLQLLAVDTIARGDISSCPIKLGRILARGSLLGASGFLLVHNHPSGDAEPSLTDIEATQRIAVLARDMELPLIDHLIIAGDKMISVGCW